MKKKILIISIGLLLSGTLFSQDYEKHHFDFGIGAGLNYGGFGFSVSIAPIPFVSIDGHFGFNMVQAVYGGGLSVYLRGKTTKNTWRPSIKGFYGYNAVYKVINLRSLDKTYYGVNIGFGNEFRFGSSKRHGLNVDLIVPIRTEDAKDYYDYIESRTDYISPLMPIGISFGYHFEF